MPTYKYTAVSKEGERIEGEEAAKDEPELARVLRQKGFLLTESQAAEPQQGQFRFLKKFSGLFGVPLEEKLSFMRNLKVMVAASIALPRVLEVLSSQARSKKLKAALEDMQSAVLRGEQLSSSMAQHPLVFPELFVNMVRTGEESGTLEKVLSQLVLQLEREHELKTRVQGALLYPAVIVTAMFGIGILMIVMVVPQLAATFKELQVPLPATTRMVIGLADFLTRFWYLALLLAAGIVLGGLQAVRTRQGKAFLDTVLLKTPIIGPIIKKLNTALFARTMSSLVASGIPMVRALEVTATVLGNMHFRNVLLKGAQEMRKGGKLSEQVAKAPKLYPLVVVQMLEVGEETGQTAELLSKLADFFEEDVSNTTKNLASVLEPALMLLIGAAVGFFAVSMLQPMYAMLGSVQ